MIKTTNTIDHDIAEFNGLRSKYDAFYQFSDDHSYYMRHVALRHQMAFIRRLLGLFGQNLTIPVANLQGEIRYV
tara:strand:- start:2895 stop:3116 length:222 start_codon:yes stop_codon:yes gene_type:complete